MEIKKLNKFSYNPGSQEAIKRGCKCPRMDNNYGKGVSNGNFWIIETCPLHGSSLIDAAPIKIKKIKTNILKQSLEERLEQLEERVFNLEDLERSHRIGLVEMYKTAQMHKPI